MLFSRSFAEECQEREKGAFEDRERRFRQRSDEAAGQVEALRAVTRVIKYLFPFFKMFILWEILIDFLQKVQKSSSESLGRLESACETGTTDLLRWRSDGAASAEAFRAELDMLVRKWGGK